jgi:hypothetical protein
MYSAPLLPEDELPEDSTIIPLAPAVPALAVLSKMEPLLPAVFEPGSSATVPPLK